MPFDLLYYFLCFITLIETMCFGLSLGQALFKKKQRSKIKTTNSNQYQIHLENDLQCNHNIVISVCI